MITRRSFLRFAAACATGTALAYRASGAEATPTLAAQRLGWAGVRLRLGSDNLYIDPLVDPNVWGPALTKPLIPLNAEGDSGFVLITHRHPDHCDPRAIAKLVGKNGALVSTTENGTCTIPPGIGIRAGALYEPQLLGEFTATPVPASDGYGDPQVSWIVSAGNRRIIHCGDTMWHGYWWRIGRQFGPFDAAFLPINGARFGWRKPVSNIPAVMTPEQAVAAAVVLGAQRLIPIHYGMAPSAEYMEVARPEEILRSEGERRGVRVQILQPGEWVNWD
jgi:L-ascorbate metabolism protein UlaG (beta-lactamase superfamily)